MNNKENMNEYDDQDDQDDLSSSNSFRARSNTWPLKRPDITLPSSGVCIDETLPEIELEDDDLFTTNENWATGLVDTQDIMSWDPILNAQNQHHSQQQQQQQQQPQQQQQQPATIHHHHQQQEPQQPQQQPQPQPQLQQQQQQQHPQHPQPPQQPHHHHHHHHHHQQAQHPTHPVNQHQHHQHPHQQPPPPIPITHGHQRHQSIHIHNQQQQQSHHQHHQHHHHHHHRQDLHQHPPNDPFLDAVSSNPNNLLLPSQTVVQMPQQRPQLQQRLSPTQHPTHIQHQTLNSVHCLDQDESNEYHIQQMHHLSLDNHTTQPHERSQQDHYAPTLTSMCIHNPSNNLNNDTSYNITTNHHDQNHHHLQSLSSARYEIDPQDEYELKAPHDDTLGPHVEHQPMNQPTHHHNPHMIHLHHHQQTHHQLQTTSSSLDNHSGGSHLLSSSLSTSGIGLSGDLEDLDYNHTLDSSIVLPNPSNDDQLQKPQNSENQSTDGAASETRQSDSTSNLKTKLNAPRRNAWGNMSYADLISQAINSTSDKRLTLSQIYDWMVQHVPYFKDKGDSNSSAGWKNSVRHNLSLHSRFKRLQNEGTGKSSWWTINPEANIGKCARRRAASMEASKYEKKRGRAKKKADAIRQGLISYPSLSNSSLNGSTTALGQQDSQAQTLNQFHDSPQAGRKSEQSQQQQQQPKQQSQPKSQPKSQSPQQQTQTQASSQAQPQPQPQPQLQNLDQFTDLQPPSINRPQLQIQTLDHYVIDQPSQQQQQHLQHLQQSDAQSCDDLNSHVQQQQTHEQSLFMPQQPPQHQELRYEENNDSNKIHQQQQQQPQQQQQQYYYPFELSTVL